MMTSSSSGASRKVLSPNSSSLVPPALPLEKQASPSLAVEPCVSQQHVPRVTPHSARQRCIDNELDQANPDASGTSNSSSDTVSAAKAPVSAQGPRPVASCDQSRRHTDRSSSSSSSSSSLLSSAHSNAGPYETPLTAALNQHDYNAKLERSLDEPGYPFPQVTAAVASGEKVKPNSARKDSDDLWKHTDDLLGPSYSSAPRQPYSKVSTSTLSLSKPDPLADAAMQQASVSQATTPMASEMDRRDSQSSSSSSRSVNPSKSASSQSGRTGPTAVRQSNSSNSLTKLSSSSSPAGSSGMASFSPLSPLVQPFSPSTSAVNLPNKVSAPSRTTSASASNSRAANLQSVATVQTVNEGTLASQHAYPMADYIQRRQATGDSLLEASTTSSSGDTGYFSACAPGAPAYASTSGDVQRSGGLPDVFRKAAAQTQDQLQSTEPSRQRYFSGDEGLVMSSATAGGVEHSFNPGLPPSATQGNWGPAIHHLTNEEQFAYEDSRLSKHAGTYVEPMMTGHPMLHAKLQSMGQRGMSFVRGVEQFDAGTYGYGPSSVSDVSTAGGEEICTM